MLIRCYSKRSGEYQFYMNSGQAEKNDKVTSTQCILANN